jgi:uncharacterized repeat protein (TIGR02543 family)
LTVNVYYDRCYYLLILDLDGGYGVDSVYGRYGASLADLQGKGPKKAGYKFDVWELQTTNDDVEKNELPTTIPACNLTYQAQWNAVSSSYMVIFWLEDADCTNENPTYSVLGTYTDYEDTGTTVSISKYTNIAPSSLSDYFAVPTEFTTLQLASYIVYDEDTTKKMNSGATEITVAGDKSSVINIYYKRNEYTLRFYYAMSDNTDKSNVKYYVVGGSTFYFGSQATETYTGSGRAKTRYINDSVLTGTTVTETSGGVAIRLLDQYMNEDVYKPKWNNNYYPNNQRGQVKEKPKLIEAIETSNIYTLDSFVSKENENWEYYYIAFTAKYGANLEDLWPCNVFQAAETLATSNTDNQSTTVSAWNGEYNVYYTQHSDENNENETIKGKYGQLDYRLLWDQSVATTNSSIVSYVCFWENGAGQGEKEYGGEKELKWSVPELYRYKIWVALEGSEEAPKGKETCVNDGVTYYSYDEYDTCDDSDVSKQTAPTIMGLTYIKNSLTWDNLYDNSKAPLGKESALTDDEIAKLKEQYPKEAYQVNFFYERNTYMLTFVNGGTTEQTYSVSYLTNISGKYYEPNIPSTLEDGAYVFAGWYTGPNGTGDKYEFTTMPAKNVVLYANWVLKEHTVTFYESKADAEKAESGIATEPVKHNEQLSDDTISEAEKWCDDWLSKQEKEDNYSFVGWFYEEDGVEKMFYEGQAVTKDLNLYPKWNSSKQAEYTVYYKLANSEIDVATPTIGYAQVGTTQTVTAKAVSDLDAPYNSGSYLTAPTSDTKEIAIEPITQEDSSNSVTFYYTENQVTITYEVGVGTEYGTVSLTNDSNAASESVNVFTGDPDGATATANDGYRFVGWYTDEECQTPVADSWVSEGTLKPGKSGTVEDANGETVGIFEEIIYYAKFEPATASLTIEKAGETVDQNDTFIFDVTDDNKKVVATVTITGTGSVTVSGLTVGKTYTVTEQTDWSWRYESSSEPSDGKVEIKTGDNSITITNKKTTTNWLSAAAAAVNRWTSTGSVENENKTTN